MLCTAWGDSSMRLGYKNAAFTALAMTFPTEGVSSQKAHANTEKFAQSSKLISHTPQSKVSLGNLNGSGSPSMTGELVIAMLFFPIALAVVADEISRTTATSRP